MMESDTQTGEEFSTEFLRERCTPRGGRKPNGAAFDYSQNHRRTYSDCSLDSPDFVPVMSFPAEVEIKDYYDNLSRYKYHQFGGGVHEENYHPYGARNIQGTLSRNMKFLCSFGGKILPRPSDGNLRYVGGETRIVSIRQNLTWEELAKKTFAICKQPHVIKYQLPGEDLDALISVSCDEDFQHLVEEYYGLERNSNSNSGSQRLRLFLISLCELESPQSFEARTPKQTDSDYHYVSAINSILDVSSQSSSGQSLASPSALSFETKNCSPRSPNFKGMLSNPAPQILPKLEVPNQPQVVHKDSPLHFYVTKNILSDDSCFIPTPLMKQHNLETRGLQFHHHRSPSGDVAPYPLHGHSNLKYEVSTIKERALSDSQLHELDEMPNYPQAFNKNEGSNYQVTSGQDENQHMIKMVECQSKNTKLNRIKTSVVASYQDGKKHENHITLNNKGIKVETSDKSCHNLNNEDSISFQSQFSNDSKASLVREPVLIIEDVTNCTHNQGMEAENIAPELDFEEVKSESLDDPAMAEIEANLYGLQTIKNEDLEELKELGSGTYGTVYLGKWRGTDVAIKRIKKTIFSGKLSEQERLTNEFWREAQILSKLHHPNVVAFYGVVPNGPGGTMATITEYMVNGSLRNVLARKERSLDRRKKLLIAMDAAIGMEYLHLKNIVHFDLKCENLLVNLKDPQRPICKVGDFGLSKIKHNTLVTGGVRGTLPWMAPELLNGNNSRVSEKVDIFSFGVTLWEILTGEEPYADMHCGAIIGGIVSNTLRPSIPERCDIEWRKLMEECWSFEPASRPSFTEVANRLRVMSTTLQPKQRNNIPI